MGGNRKVPSTCLVAGSPLLSILSVCAPLYLLSGAAIRGLWTDWPYSGAVADERC